MYTNFHPLFYPLRDGIYQNPFLRVAYAIVALCMQSLSPIGLKLTKFHTNFHPLFYPLGGRIDQNPFLADAYVITSTCMPNFSPIRPVVSAVL